MGSSSYITNLDGEITQHMEYLPFGETLIEEHLNSNNSPYKFNAKEMDAETGNYYYGARYYDPKFSIWLSVDPMAEKYVGWSPYNYTLQNPIKYIDPDGKYVDISFIYARNDDGTYKNQNLVDGFEAFASSKEGISFMSNYAEKGQIIAEIKYSKNGQFHNRKIDLDFGNLEKGDRADATTSLEETSGRLNIALNFKEKQTTEDYIENIGHEGFLHADKFAVDYADDQKINFSSGIDKDIVKYVDSQTDREKARFNHHFQERRDKVLEKKLAPILSQYYNSKGIYKTDREVINKVNEFAN